MGKPVLANLGTPLEGKREKVPEKKNPQYAPDINQNHKAVGRRHEKEPFRTFANEHSISNLSLRSKNRLTKFI